MGYTPGHSVWVAYALENAFIDQSVAPHTITAPPTSFTYLGYMDVPEVTEEFGTKKGFSVGSPIPMYTAKGQRNPSISFNIRLGNLGFLGACLRGNHLPYGMQPLTIYVGVDGAYTDIYRYCIVESLALSAQEGSAQEVTAQVTLQAMARQFSTNGTYVKNPSASALSSPQGAPFLWHDAREFVVTANDNSEVDYRKFISGVSVTVAHNLERKGQRPNWGDNAALSRTCYDIMPHNVVVTGEINLHDRLPEKYFTELVRSEDWGPIVIPISDAAGINGGETAKEMTLTLVNPNPTSRTNRGVESGAQISHSIAFVADNLTLT